jgi:hypothetical protein
MVLILLSIIVAAIAVAVIVTRGHISFGSLAGSVTTKESIVRVGAEQPSIAGPTKKFLVVVLPDGKIVNPVLADRF